ARAAAARLADAVGQDFYLAGGTGLALWRGHRISLDLDLFSSASSLDTGERRRLIDDLAGSGPLSIIHSREGTCHLLVGRTSVSLFRYRYPLLDRASAWRGLSVASVRDIAAMKVSAVVGRGARKDFVDLYVICREMGIDAVLEACHARFPDHHDFLSESVRALVYFEDAEKEPMPRLLTEISWPAVRTYFEEDVRRILRQRLEPPD
ncbi:MAG: nucleotidyl transferase AbiEii/AbiGii toxin family protein, partial [Acidobacteriota bacterium]